MWMTGGSKRRAVSDVTESVLNQLGITELYQAPSRGEVHTRMSCRHLKHLNNDSERDKIVRLVWCGDCKTELLKNVDKMKEE